MGLLTSKITDDDYEAGVALGDLLLQELPIERVDVLLNALESRLKKAKRPSHVLYTMQEWLELNRLAWECGREPRFSPVRNDIAMAKH